MDTTANAAKGILQRARASVDGSRPPGGRSAASTGERSAGVQVLARRFADALMADDIDAVVALLSDDAWLAMPPAPHEYHGPRAIASFFRASARWKDARVMRLIATRANNQPDFGMYLTAPCSAVTY